MVALVEVVEVVGSKETLKHTSHRRQTRRCDCRGPHASRYTPASSRPCVCDVHNSSTIIIINGGRVPTCALLLQ